MCPSVPRIPTILICVIDLFVVPLGNDNASYSLSWLLEVDDPVVCPLRSGSETGTCLILPHLVGAFAPGFEWGELKVQVCPKEPSCPHRRPVLGGKDDYWPRPSLALLASNFIFIISTKTLATNCTRYGYKHVQRHSALLQKAKKRNIMWTILEGHITQIDHAKNTSPYTWDISSDTQAGSIYRFDWWSWRPSRKGLIIQAESHKQSSPDGSGVQVVCCHHQLQGDLWFYVELCLLTTVNREKSISEIGDKQTTGVLRRISRLPKIMEKEFQM